MKTYQILKEVFAFMQNNFRGRLFRAYVLNAPWSFSTAYSGVKVFMEDSTASKVVISSENSDPAMQTHIHPSQLDSRFGGTAPTVTQFWPPSLPNGEIFIESNPTKLISVGEYQDLKTSGQLSTSRLSPHI